MTERALRPKEPCYACGGTGKHSELGTGRLIPCPVCTATGEDLYV
jgi:hypothetical protein